MSKRKDPNEVSLSGVSVEVKGNNFKRAMRDFIRKTQEAGIIKECKQRAHYEKPSEERRRRKKEAIRKHNKKKSQEVHTRKY